MSITKQEVMNQILHTIIQLASDWEFNEEVTTQTYMFAELGFQSLDAVVLGNSLQEHFGQPIPYADLLEDIGQREHNDITVDEWADFTYQYLANNPHGTVV